MITAGGKPRTLSRRGKSQGIRPNWVEGRMERERYSFGRRRCDLTRNWTDDSMPDSLMLTELT